jgi:hypothetical protein
VVKKEREQKSLLTNARKDLDKTGIKRKSKLCLLFLLKKRSLKIDFV